MGSGHEIDNTVADASSNQANPALLQAIIETHGKYGDSRTTASLASVNVTNRFTQEMSINNFPNGVKFGTGDGAQLVEAPNGGKVVANQKGGMDVYDSHHKKVAELDANKTMHVHTRNGEYTESKDGQVVFEPLRTGDLSSLHKKGIVEPSKLENYGVSSDGKTTRFPNGVNYEPRTGQVVIPAEYPNFQEERFFDEHHNLTKRLGLNGDGQVLYTIDNKGIHVPTTDGTISQSHNGTVRFESPQPQGKHLPKMSIDDDLKKMMDECGNSNDPLCGLDLDGKL
ncbi:MAG: hypothetical protein JST01_13130 [Cyanobacteria bacterium SZAS TMP-1]|nr:hypothetical protein [Cyanobacteria bacterium SZAS TMP-1]